VSGVRALTLTVFLALMCPVAAGCAAAEEDEAGSSRDALQSPQGAAKAASTALEAARTEQLAIDTRLAHELGAVGPALTTTQNETYVRAFYALPENKDVRTRYLAASDALAKEITSLLASSAALATVMAGPPGGRGTQASVFGPEDLYHACTLLAQSPAAAPALKVAVRALAHDPAFARWSKTPAQIEDEILGPALPNALVAKLLVEKDTDTALAQLHDSLATAVGAAPQVSDAIDQIRRNQGKPVTVAAFESRPLGKFVTGLSVIVAIWDMGSGVNALRQNDLRGGLEQFLGGTASAAESLGVAADTYRTFLHGGVAPKWAGPVTEIAGRVGGGIAGVFAVIDLVESAGRWNAGNGEKVEVLANCLSVASAVGAVLGASAASGGLGIIAVGALFLARYLEDQQAAAQERSDRERILPTVGLDRALVDKGLVATLVAAEPAMLSRLADDLSLSVADIQWLGSEYPSAITGVQPGGGATQLLGLSLVDDVFSLSGAEMAGFLRAIAAGETDPTRRAFALRLVSQSLYFGVTEAGKIDSGMTKQRVLAWFDAAATSTSVVSTPDARAAWQAACVRARVYLASK